MKTLYQYRVILLILLLVFSGLYASAQLPEVTVRFNNPTYICETQTYCLDVEFLSQYDQTQLFGINVRFFYDDVILEYLGMGDFADGYGPYDPDPAEVTTYGASTGSAFGFPAGHAPEFINGAVQISGSSTVFLSSTEWTKLFNICFHVDDPNSLEIASFCPSVIWDLEEPPGEGGFVSTSNGVVITLVEGDNSTPTTEIVEQFNWAYDGIFGLPYGNPVETVCIPTTCLGPDDFADAPEGALAYPELNITGLFPTCLDPTISGYISHQVSDTPVLYFGPSVDAEVDGNAGICSPYGAPYNNDECFADGDAGLLFPVTHTINGIAYSPCAAGDSLLTVAADTMYWGIDLDITVTNISQDPAYVNVLIDWNRNGMWDYDPTTIAWGNVIPEHCLVNFLVPPGFTGPLSLLNPPPIWVGPYHGYLWSRFSITEVPVNMQFDNPTEPNWDGSGVFLLGETEDYLVLVGPRKEIPLSDWALVIGIVLIAAYTVTRLRKN